MEKNAIELVVDLTDGGLPLRIDQYLHTCLPEFSRSFIQKLIEGGNVLVNDEKTKSSLKLCGGEVILVSVPAAGRIAVGPEEIPLEILFEDKYLAVINKPAGMVVHPGAGVREGTLVNALLYHLNGSLSGISGELRPGIVHRLDKDTSGLMVVAKEDKTHRNLQEQIHDKLARRVYLAVLEGVMKTDSATIEKPIGRHPAKRKEMAVTPKGKRAVSHYKVLARSHQYTLVEVDLETGRTHQIRVHMASLGYPVVGDLTYNRKSTGTLAAREKLGLCGHALHAFQLTFRHPISGESLQFQSRLPEDFEIFIQKAFGTNPALLSD